MDIRVGDFGFDIPFTITDDTGEAVPLTGVAEIKFKVVDIESYRNLLDGTCVVVEALAGTCKYTVQQNDFKKEGNFFGTLRLKYSASKYVSSKKIFITVEKSLGGT